MSSPVTDYAQYHAKRFRFLLECLKRHLPDRDSRVLEVGRGPFTSQLHEVFPNLTTLGFPLERSYIAQLGTADSTIPHVIFDLCDSPVREKWPRLAPFDAIVFAEVIEHLYVAPEHAVACLASLLKPGGLLFCQTPNAAAAHSRIKLLMGRNPYNRIAIDGSEPAHFREYTKSELGEILASAGLRIVEHQFANYFGYENPLTGIVDSATGWIPSFRRGQTIVARKG